jgi:ZIP family zinc transporter
MTVIVIACAAFVSTLVGGLVALKLRDQLHLILGFSAGAVIGVAFFDLLPESIELGEKYFAHGTVTGVVALGFLVYLILDRLVLLHAHAHSDDQDHERTHERSSAAAPSRHVQRGILGAGSLSIHSFLDGVAIGLAFQVSAAIGVIVAVAVLVHDFSDGINTVSLILKNTGEKKRALHWLIVDAVAPVVGAASTLLFRLPEEGLSIVLAVFSGFFLYIGASDLIPESHHAHPKFLTTVMTLLGAAVLYAAIVAVHGLRVM